MSLAAHALEPAAVGAIVVTPSPRLARLLKQDRALENLRAGNQVWPTPHILPWEAWLEELWEQALYAGLPLPARLDADQELWIWERILATAPEAAELLDLPAAAEAAQHCWALIHAWQLDRREIEAAASEDTRAFLGWAREFEHLSELQAWLEPARRADHLATRLGKLPLPPAVELAGFQELTPQQRAFLVALEQRGARVHVQEEPALTPRQLVRVRFTDRPAEIEAAARWARSLLERGEANKVGVLLPDLERLARQVDRIFTRVLEPSAMLPGATTEPRCFNISAAPPLDAQPLVHAALLALELDRARNPLRRICSLLHSSFLGAAETERGARAVLARSLRERGITEISIPALRRTCQQHGCPEMEHALARWTAYDEALPGRQRPSTLARDFSRLLEALGWPGERSLSSQERQAWLAWNDVLDRLARLDAVSEPMKRSEALAWLKRLASRKRHQPESELAPVQVLSVNEALGLHFDALWVAGLDEESWPPAPRPDPFLPLALQRRHRLPHCSAEREREVAQRLWQRLLASAPYVVTSWPEQDEDRELGLSPLLRNVPEVTQADLGLSAVPSYAWMPPASAQTEEVKDERGPALEPGVVASGGSRVFQLQALCPFRAFAELRLGAAAVRLFEPGLSRIDRGEAVHAALEAFWRCVASHEQLCARGAEELRSLLVEAIEKALARVRARRDDLPPRLAELERCRLLRLLEKWLEIEKQRPPFRVIECEQRRQIELAGVRAEVRADRIDRLEEDGRELIIDYKTGTCETGAWKPEHFADPQLPLYAVTHNQPVAGLAFAQIKTGDLCFKGLAHSPHLAPGLRPADIPAQLQRWREKLEELGTRFREGHAQVDPLDDDACRRCRMWPLCRVHQAAPAVQENEGE